MTTKQNTKPTVVLNDKRNWHPEIYYEEGTDGMAGQFPFVQIPNDKDMPTIRQNVEEIKEEQQHLRIEQRGIRADISEVKGILLRLRRDGE